VMLSVLLLDESFGPRFLIGTLLVVVGITLVSAHSFISKQLGLRSK